MLKRENKIVYNAIAEKSLYSKKTQFVKCSHCRFEYSLCSAKKLSKMHNSKTVKCPACGRKDKENEMR